MHPFPTLLRPFPSQTSCNCTPLNTDIYYTCRFATFPNLVKLWSGTPNSGLTLETIRRGPSHRGHHQKVRLLFRKFALPFERFSIAQGIWHLTAPSSGWFGEDEQFATNIQANEWLGWLFMSQGAAFSLTRLTWCIAIERAHFSCVRRHTLRDDGHGKFIITHSTDDGDKQS
jgi:hypothetical protein